MYSQQQFQRQTPPLPGPYQTQQPPTGFTNQQFSGQILPGTEQYVNRSSVGPQSTGWQNLPSSPQQIGQIQPFVGQQQQWRPSPQQQLSPVTEQWGWQRQQPQPWGQQQQQQPWMQPQQYQQQQQPFGQPQQYQPMQQQSLNQQFQQPFNRQQQMQQPFNQPLQPQPSPQQQLGQSILPGTQQYVGESSVHSSSPQQYAWGSQQPSQTRP